MRGLKRRQNFAIGRARRHSQWRLRTIVATLALALLVNSQIPQTAASATVARHAWQEPPQSPINKVNNDLFLPQLMSRQRESSDDESDDLNRPEEGSCPTSSGALFGAVPVLGSPADRPPELHADLNLAVRGYSSVIQPLTLVDIDGQVDPDAPQLAGVVGASGRPQFIATYQINDWDWNCQENYNDTWAGHGCRADAITDPAVTLLAFLTQPEMPVRTPPRQAQIYADGSVALVLYADTERLTLVYTREDTAAHGYVVHLEGFCVDASLLSLYRTLNAAGRTQLPAVRSLEQLGTANQESVKIAVRDTGSFLDPRSRKDWWKEY